MNTSVQSSTVELEIEQLLQRQAQCEAEELYREAEELEQQIRRLQKTSQASQRRELKAKHAAEAQNAEDNFAEELAEFHASWDQTLAELQATHQDQLNKLEEKQAAQLKQETMKAEVGTPVACKPSAYLLNLMKCKDTAVKRKQYAEADALKATIAELRATEQRTYNEERKAKIQNCLQQLQAQFQKAKDSLLMKQANAVAELKTQRQHAYQTLVKKQNNVRQGLNNLKQTEDNLVAGRLKNAGSRDSPFKSKFHSAFISLTSDRP